MSEETALHEVARGLARAYDVPGVLRRIVELSHAAGEADASYLERIDLALQEVEVVASAGDGAAVGARVPYPGSLAEEVIERDEPEIITYPEMARRPIARVIGETCGECTALVAPLISEGEALGALILLRRPERSPFRAEDAARVRLLADMAALALRRVFLQDEAERRLRELEESERRFRLLVESVQDYAIFMLDPGGRVVGWNAGAERIKGYRAGEIGGQHFRIFYPPEESERRHPEENLRRAREAGRYEEEGWRIRKDGSRFWAHVTITAIRGLGGALLGYSKVTRDLSERRRAEQAREIVLERERAAHEQVATVLERITDAFFALDREWRFTYMNGTTRQIVQTLLQREPDEVIGESFWDVVWQFRGTRFEREYRGAMETQQAVHFEEYAEAFGVWFEVHAYPSPEGLSIYFRDVTARRRTEEAADLERRRLRSVLDALPVGVFISDAEGRILEANAAAQAIWGGRAPLPARTEEYAEYRAYRPGTGVAVAPDEWALVRALRSGEVVRGEELEIEPFDGERKTILNYAQPIRDASGAVVGGVVVNVDITARQELLRQAQAARAEAERANRAKSEFLATMSHELRTPINAIIGYTELLDMGLTGPVTPAQRSQLERVRASSAHLLGLINDVLDLAKVEAGRMTVELQRAAVRHAAGAALALVGPLAAERGIRLEDRGAGGAEVEYCGDEDRVRQILVNLLGNAVKFTNPGGSVRLSCGTTERPDAEARLEGEGPWVCVRVEDTGIGIPPEKLEAVFQPFVQAESGHARQQGGTGLGLAISRELARLMGGDLTARSRPGEGSVFTLWLPAAERSTSASRAETRGGVPRREVLGAAARAVLEKIEPIMDAYAARLRQDPLFAEFRELADADLRDHAVAFLSDIAQSLIGWEESDTDPEAALRDGGAIQRLISELHGAQRVRLGWTEEQIRREFEVLRQEVERAVRAGVRPPPGAGLEDALGVLLRCITSAERISLRVMGGPGREGQG